MRAACLPTACPTCEHEVVGGQRAALEPLVGVVEDDEVRVQEHDVVAQPQRACRKAHSAQQCKSTQKPARASWALISAVRDHEGCVKEYHVFSQSHPPDVHEPAPMHEAVACSHVSAGVWERRLRPHAADALQAGRADLAGVARGGHQHDVRDAETAAHMGRTCSAYSNTVTGVAWDAPSCCMNEHACMGSGKGHELSCVSARALTPASTLSVPLRRYCPLSKAP